MDWVPFILSVSYGSILLLVWGWLRRPKLPKGTILPPKPPTSSIIGHPELRQPNFHREKALQWAKEYGPVFRLRMYFTSIVVVNDMESIKKFCVGNKTLHRPDLMNFGRNYYPGVLTMNGDLWWENRRACMAILRDLGFAKSTVENRLLSEFRNLEEEIELANGSTVNLRLKIVECAASNMASFFLPRMQSDRRVREQFTDILKRIFVHFQVDKLYYFWPPFWKTLSLLFPFTCAAKADSLLRELDSLIIREINSHVYLSGQKTFIEEYSKLFSEATRTADSSYLHRYLVGNIKMLINGGVDGPSISMHLGLVILAARPNDIQRRVQGEIDAIIGHKRLPSWEDRKRMPFTVAFIWELERWKRTEPFGLPRGTDKDIVVDNFFIPKGTVVLFNLWSVNRDPLLWKDPHRFDPYRYFQEDGSLTPEKPAYHIGFSYGKRACPGEAFALMEIFLMITFMLQRYDVCLDQKLCFDLDDPGTTLDCLKQTNLRFKRRLARTTHPTMCPNKG